MVGDASTLRPFWKAFYLGKASYFRLGSKLHTLALTPSRPSLLPSTRSPSFWDCTVRLSSCTIGRSRNATTPTRERTTLSPSYTRYDPGNVPFHQPPPGRPLGYHLAYRQVDSVKKMPFEAIGILDEATVYAFVGQEELGFIEVFKSYGDPIVDDPAKYDVTVLKVDYSAPVEDDFQGSFATVANAAIEGERNEGGSSTPPPSSPSWIKPAFIAGASAVAFASTAAALLLWRQRRGDAYVDDGHKKPEDSPRSLDPTAVPSTPSPAVFMDRFNKKKTQFNYAEFEDGNVDVEEPSFCAEGDAVISPRTNSNGRSGSNRHPTNDIEYAERDTSFDFYDDSSVSDVSAHLLGARGSIRKNDTNLSEAESVLLVQLWKATTWRP